MSSRDDETIRVSPPASPTVRENSDPPTGDDLVGVRLGGYVVLKELGRGGMGTVYLGEDVSLRRRVALKVLPAGLGASAEARARFRREAEAASKLEHPHLCGVIGVGEDLGLRWIAMRYVPGVTLDRNLRDQRARRDAAVSEGGKSSTRTEIEAWRAAAEFVETASRAVHVAHEAGIVHRDLKPQNLMVQEDGSPVVLDFGLAQDQSEAALTQTGDVLGTPNYMAPEQVRGDARRADRRADVWALGVTLYELLALRRPFEAPTREGLWRAILEKDPAPLRKSIRGFPRDLDVVLAVAMAKDPDRRYATAAALADDLRAVLDLRPISARAPGLLARAWMLARRRRAAALLVALLVAGVPLTFGLWFEGRREATKVARLADDRLGDARAALGLRRLAVAADAVDRLRHLAPEHPALDELARALELRRMLDSAEALVLDADADRDGRAAIAALDRVDAQGPRLLESAALRALVLARTKSLDAARESLDASGAVGAREFAALCAPGAASRVAAPDEDPDFAFFSAQLLLARGEDRAALLRFERLLERSPERHWFAWGAAESAAKLHEHHAALAFAGRAKALGGTATPERLGRYSTHLRRAGLVEESVRAAEEALRQGGEKPILLLHLGNALADGRRRDEAEAALRRAAEIDPSLSETWSALGAVLFERGKYEDAAEALKRSLSIADEAAARINLGNAYIELHKYEAAEVELRRGLALRPDSAYAWNSLSSALIKQGRFDDAEQASMRALDALPNYAVGLATLGALLQRRGDLAGAERRLRAAAALGSKDPIIRFRLACCIFQSKPAEAEALLRVLIEEVPDDAAFLTKLAEALGNRRAFAEAEPLARRATEIDPKAARGWLVRALAEAGLERLDSGAEFLRRAVECEPDNPVFHIAVVDMAAGKDPLEDYARIAEAIRLQPELGADLRARIESARARLEDFVETPEGELDAEGRAIAAHPLARLVAGDSTEALAAAARALPDGPRGSTAATVKAAAVALLK